MFVRPGSIHRTAQPAHELRFVSLHNPGRAVSVPCDAQGKVDLDGLSDRLRTTYLGARTMIGREYGYPVVRALH